MVHSRIIICLSMLHGYAWASMENYTRHINGLLAAISGDLYSYMVLCMVVNGDILVFVIGVLIHKLKYNFC